MCKISKQTLMGIALGTSLGITSPLVSNWMTGAGWSSVYILSCGYIMGLLIAIAIYAIPD